MKSWNWRLIVIAGLTLWALYAASPTFIYFAQPSEVKSNQELLQSKIPDWLPSKHINLGLDLQGGIQLVLGVNTEEAVENKLGSIGTEITRWAQDNKKSVESAYVVKNQGVLRVILKPGTDIDKLREEIQKEFPGLEQANREDNSFDLRFESQQIADIKASALEQAERVIRSRVDKWGVAEPLIARRADKTVLVQLPGFSDPEKAKSLLGKTAQLKFKIVDSGFQGFKNLMAKDIPEVTVRETTLTEGGGTTFVLESENREALIAATAGYVPEDRELLLERTEIAGGKKAKYVSYVVFATTELTGEDILDATVGFSSSSLDNAPSVSLRFTGPGGKRFGDVTGANVGKLMAIVLDDEVVSAPRINQKIAGGQAEITMGGDRGAQEILDESNELALILKSGALPARIEVLEERQVGASLGPELASQGVRSAVMGLFFVLVFMVVYYRRPGVIACVALTLNGLFLIATMAAFGFALTLPGIAGFILTIGMAVDANVLINERIRQELREGKNAKKAVELGFDKVFWTIMDSNITTLIATLVLLETNSSGPIRGFAITLMLGLIISLFTSLYCTKAFFNLALRNQTTDRQVRTWLGSGGLSEGAKPWNFNFLRWGFPVTVAGVLLAVATLSFIGFKGGLNWSVDFAGGTEMEVFFDKDVNTQQIRDVMPSANIDIQKLDGSTKKYVMRFDKDDKSQEAGALASVDSNAKSFQTALETKLADAGPKVQRIDYVGPKVGKELRTQGIMSAFLAIIGIMAYIFLRFDMRFGPGAALKMIQDAFVVLAFYAFGWVTFDLTSVAAILTVIGYSVNDVIVIFDRIRENFAMFPKRKVWDNINISLNETFTRSINTSVSTLISLIGILVFGTSQIWNFAAAMSIGIVAATISSTFVASVLLLWFENMKSRPGPAAVATAKR